TKCPECNETWGAAGVEYPCMDVPHKFAESFTPGVVPWSDFLTLRRSLPSIVPLVVPGTHFGPIVGSFRGGPMTFDFNWLRSWTLLVKSTAIEALGGVLNKHQTARPSLAYPKGIRDELLELQIDPK